MEVLVLNVGAPYDFMADSGRRMQGFKVSYCPLAAQVTNKDFVGKVVVSKSLQLEFREYFDFSKVPGVYDFDFRSAYSPRGELVQALAAVKYKRDVKLEDLR